MVDDPQKITLDHLRVDSLLAILKAHEDAGSAATGKSLPARYASKRARRLRGIGPPQPAQKPWLAEGLSKSAYYRRQRKQAQQQAAEVEFASKYAESLYENVTHLINSSKTRTRVYTLDEFRDLLGVPPGSYETFGDLNKDVIKPAVDKINALAAFTVSVRPVKKGRKPTHEIRIGWRQKDAPALHGASQRQHEADAASRRKDDVRRMNLMSGAIKDGAGRPPKLTAEQRREVLERRANGETLEAIARSYGVTFWTIRHVIKTAKAAENPDHVRILR